MPSIRADAATEIMTRTTNLPQINLFTWMGWVYFSALAGTYNLTFHRGASADNNFLAVGAWNNGGYKTYLSDYANDWSGSTVTTGVWYHYAWTRSGSTHTLFLNGVSDIVQTSADNPATAAVHIFGQASGGADPMNGRVACVKEWSGVALTAGQIRREMEQYLPRESLAQLNGFWPMNSLADYTIDYGPRKNRWTTAGTITSEEGPPIPWGVIKQNDAPWMNVLGGATTSMLLRRKNPIRHLIMR